VFVIREGESPSVGRDPASAIVFDDPSVSARHAELRWSAGAWLLRDAGSKNGTFLNGVPAASEVVADGDWIGFGGLLARFDRVEEEELERARAERERRWTTSAEIRRELDRAPDPECLLRRLMESILGLVGADRGFLLMREGDGVLHAEIAVGFTGSPGRDGFPGSLGAVERVLSAGRSVVAADARADVFLGRRPSVVEMGLGALACVPLKADDRLLGVVYVDGRRAGGPFTELDLEILEALAEHAAILLSTVRIDQRIRELLRTPAAAGFLDEIEEHLARVPAARGAVS
jgi:pSer/pThr/pTyr-binding forkhead associated (FHA) protein